jgi:hypothetical protein
VKWLADRKANAKKGWRSPVADDPQNMKDPEIELKRYKAARERLKFEVEVKNLVAIDQLKPSLDKAFNNLRTRLLKIADTLAPRIAVVDHSGKCKELIYDEIVATLQGIAAEGILAEHELDFSDQSVSERVLNATAEVDGE